MDDDSTMEICTFVDGVKMVIWIAAAIICFFVFCTFFLEGLVKQKYNLPKKMKYKNRFTKKQTRIEIVMGIIFFVGALLSSISVYDTGIYRPLSPIPFQLWLALFMFLLFCFRGYMAKRYAENSRECYVHFAYAVWCPFMIVIAYYTTEIFLD